MQTFIAHRQRTLTEKNKNDSRQLALAQLGLPSLLEG